MTSLAVVEGGAVGLACASLAVEVAVVEKDDETMKAPRPRRRVKLAAPSLRGHASKKPRKPCGSDWRSMKLTYSIAPIVSNPE